MINEEIQPIEELINRNNIRIRDAAKWFHELIISTIDPARPWTKTAHQQRQPDHAWHIQDDEMRYKYSFFTNKMIESKLQTVYFPSNNYLPYAVNMDRRGLELSSWAFPAIELPISLLVHLGVKFQPPYDNKLVLLWETRKGIWKTVTSHRDACHLYVAKLTSL